MRRVLAGVFASIVVFAGAGASASVPHRHRTQAPKADLLPMGRSVGSPTNGHLVGGSHLGDAPYLRVMPADRAGDVRWGLGSLVGMIERVARRVRHLFPGAVLNVGHLSKHGGGDLVQHASHESGRDADLPFYVVDAKGKQIFSEHMVSFRGNGTSPVWPGARFDDARNWALVAALLSDPVAHVTHVFVSAPLRARLLAYAVHAGAPEALRTRAAMTMVQPRGTLPHDDHFHVRIACPEGMHGCIENPVARRHARPSRRGRSHERHDAHAQQKSAPRAHAPEPKPDAATDDSHDAEPPAAIIEAVDGDR
jgi:penicillin-insensitive murein endopeptidase